MILRAARWLRSVTTMTRTEQFFRDDDPSRQDASVAVWRAVLSPQLSVAVIKYAEESAFLARAMYLGADGCCGVTTQSHRTRGEAAAEAIRLSRQLQLSILCEKTLV